MSRNEDRAAFVTHTMEDFLKYPLEVLLLKRIEAKMCIRAAKEGLAESDYRAPRALEHYRAERKAINQAILQLRYGDEGPPDQAVNMKTVSLAGDAKRDRGVERLGVASIGDFIKLFVPQEDSNGRRGRQSL